jgi:hypothetical protein
MLVYALIFSLVRGILQSSGAWGERLKYAASIFYKIPNSYRGAGKSLARPTSRCILFDGENISFDASMYK